MNWKSGHKIYGGGGYVIQSRLGKGGFATAYLARSYRNEPVVIKTIKTEILANSKYSQDLAKFIRDFEREGSRLALFKHPNIVRLKGFFYEKNLPCICMEYIEGQDLGNLVENDGILPEKKALCYIKQVGEALSVIHRKNLLHRDVKPENIMIRSQTDEAVIIDFGIARECISEGPQIHTQLLSHGFAPLEQYDAQSKKGTYSDVYSTAATLYYMMTAEIPPASFSRIVRDSLIRPQQLNPRISDRVERAIMIGMVLRPEFRPKSIEQWLRLLDVETATNLDSLQFSANSEDVANFVNEQPRQQQKKIIPWFTIVKIALCSFPVYLLVGWFLAIYSAPNWMWLVTVISDINLKLFVLKDDNPNRELAISTWLFGRVTTTIAAMGTFYFVYQATPIYQGVLGKFLAGIVGFLLFTSIHLSLLYFFKQNLFVKMKYFRLKKYCVFSLLVAVSWLGLVLGWVLS